MAGHQARQGREGLCETSYSFEARQPPPDQLMQPSPELHMCRPNRNGPVKKAGAAPLQSQLGIMAQDNHAVWGLRARQTGHSNDHHLGHHNNVPVFFWHHSASCSGRASLVQSRRAKRGPVATAKNGIFSILPGLQDRRSDQTTRNKQTREKKRRGLPAIIGYLRRGPYSVLRALHPGPK